MTAAQEPGKSVHGPDGIFDRAGRVAAVAMQNADEVDRLSRFPFEAVDGLKRERLLSAMLPTDVGGADVSLNDIARICFMLGRGCASTAMIFAMHQIQIECISRHARQSPWHRHLLGRVCAEQLLFAGSTTDGRSGGDIRSSHSSIETGRDNIAVSKAAAVLSYGTEADGIVLTAKRNEAALPSDQVLLVVLKPDYTLQQIAAWDALGMRGTCSANYRLEAVAQPCQIIPRPFAEIHQLTMIPTAHILWSSVWAGIAADAVDRARRCVRKSHDGPGLYNTAGARHVAEAAAKLQAVRASILGAIQVYETSDEAAKQSFAFQAQINQLKIFASDNALAAAMAALRACGLSGYRNGTDFSVGRHLRDVASAPLMISNDRIGQALAGFSMAIDLTVWGSGE